VFYTARRSGLRGRKLVYIAATATYDVRGAYAHFWHFFVRCLRNRTQIYVHFTPDLRICTQPYTTVRLLYSILRVGTPISYTISTPCLCIRYATIRQPTQILRLFHENAAGVRRSTRIISA